MVTVGNVGPEPPGRTWCRQGEMPQGTASGIAVGLAGLLLAARGLAGCGAGKPARPMGVPATAAARSAAASQPRPITLGDAEPCPVTLPHSGGPPGISPDAFFGWGASYGNGTRWVAGCGRAG
jgi:hypothetical protein